MGGDPYKVFWGNFFALAMQMALGLEEFGRAIL